MDHLCVCAIISLLVVGLAAAGEEGQKPLRVQCVYHAAHGLSAVARDYRERQGVGLEFHRHCREHFSPSAKSLEDRDLYVTTSPENLAKARKAGLLAGEAVRIGRVVPIIAVARGNPQNIGSLTDLARAGLVVAYPRTCIGNVALRIVARNKLEEALEPNMTLRTGNRTGVLRPVAEGKAHAALTWQCAVIESGRDDIETVAIPREKNVIDPIFVVVVDGCRDRAAAQAFIDYLGTEPAAKLLRQYDLSD